MRNRFLWFLLGCVTGVVGLYVALWQGGILAPYMDRVRAESRVEPKAVPVPAPVPAPPVAAPASVPAAIPAATPPAPAPAPSADAPSSNGIIAPIEGLKVAEVLDTFNQSRPGGRAHEATDIMEPRGTPVHAMVDGIVKKLFLSKPGGITVYQFDDAQQYSYYYAHLDRYAEGIAEGQHIARGTVIGYVGSTGDASADAPHLHLAIFQLGPEKNWWQGTPVNPYPILMRIIHP